MFIKRLIVGLTFFSYFCTFLKSETFLKNIEILEKNISNLDWNYIQNKRGNELIWSEGINTELNSETLLKRTFKNDIDIRAYGRAVTVDGVAYPEISNYVPNAYIEDPQKITTLSLRAISKTRSCNKKNFDSSCVDGILDVDFNLLNTDNWSLNPKFTILSLSDRGTDALEGLSMGFKAAKKMSSKWSFAFGGENIIHFDKTEHLGRDFYLVASTYNQINKRSGNKGPIIFFNAGLGTDFYGYRGNGYIGRISCLGKPNLTGDGTNKCNIGPIGSVALSFNDRFALISEWFGYGYGSGLSFRPFEDDSLNFSIYATDYLGNFPSYITDSCNNQICEARFYGSISLSF